MSVCHVFMYELDDSGPFQPMLPLQCRERERERERESFIRNNSPCILNKYFPLHFAINEYVPVLVQCALVDGRQEVLVVCYQRKGNIH